MLKKKKVSCYIKPAVECGQPFMLLLFNPEGAIHSKGIHSRT